MHNGIQLAVATDNFEMARQNINKKRRLQEAAVLLQRNHIGVNETHDIEERYNNIAQVHLENAFRAIDETSNYPTTQGMIHYLAKVLNRPSFNF